MTIGVTLVGGRGYTGEVLLELIERHPGLAIARVGSRSLAGRPLREVFPTLTSDRRFEALAPEDLADEEVVVLALPNGEAAPFVAALADDRPVVDLSADHRFDPAWYYGLPELNPWRSEFGVRVANPGCYATAAQVALAPIAASIVDWPSIFGVSGFSGAGRSPSPRNDPARLADNLLPYRLTGHGHEREISERLALPVRFMPHVTGFFRGLGVTCSATLAEPVAVDQLRERYRDAYGGHPLVEVLDEPPEPRNLVGSSRAAVGGFAVDGRDPHRIVVVAALDNLLKGAASQAVQNLNAILGLDPLAGLEP